jgi:mannose/cellobiose epimerase-like protein (N-acyl-D-glucosamine 2-epimerase family)
MRYWYDKEFKGVICEPDSADEWMELIQDIAWNYDNCNTVESLKELIDEMVEMTSMARSCLIEGKVFEDKEESERCLIEAHAERERDLGE